MPLSMQIKQVARQNQINQGLRTLAGLYSDIVILQGASTGNAAEFAKRIREANKESEKLKDTIKTTPAVGGGTAKKKKSNKRRRQKRN
jgi:hypothetical protein